MASQHPQVAVAEKDELLHRLLPVLAARGIAKNWAVLEEPYSALRSEFRRLQSERAFLVQFQTYLGTNPIIVQTVETLLAQLAMAANSKWQDTPEIVQPLSRRGWHIARWLPTFLIVDGPLGRVFSAATSPFNVLLRSQYSSYPVICAARDAFNHELFRLVRNGIGHWSFSWSDGDGVPHLEMIDWDSGRTTAMVSLIEAEALHLLAFSVVEALDYEIFKFLRSRASA